MFDFDETYEDEYENEEREENYGQSLNDLWFIDNDKKADWAIERVKEHREERDRLVSLYDAKIKSLQEDRQKAIDACETRSGWLLAKLNEYMQTVKCKSTKTQKTYQLASGRLVTRLGGVEFKRDDDTLIRSLQENGFCGYVKTEARINWAELKKALAYDEESGMVAMADSGELLEGITVSRKPDTFDVM